MKLLKLHSSLFFAFLFLFSTSAHALKYPILLVHGATLKGASLHIGPMHFGKYFQGIPEHLESLGVQADSVVLSTDSSIGERAFVIKNLLETKWKGKKVNLVGHSLGGLDSRYLASVLKSQQIASITTIGTPNHGTPIANWASRQMQGGFWYYFFQLFGYNMRGRRFLPELTTDFMKNIFNPKVKNVPGVQYFSVVGTGSPWDFTLSPALYFTYWELVNEDHPMAKEPNDGLVPVSSQEWGEVIARLPLDHLAQMNHYTFRWASEARTQESLAMYTAIVKRLEKAGL